MPPGPPESHAAATPSPWVRRFAALLRPPGTVLDLAAGAGRHARPLAAAGLKVVAVDRDPAALAALSAIDGVEAVAADLENAPWPLAGRRFDAVIVTNYLWRPLMAMITASLADDGILIYETFAVGNESFGKPSNPAFLLQPGELLAVAQAAALQVVAYEHGTVSAPRAAVVQRLCARRAAGAALPGPLPPAR
ncbi:MAG: class I SAM-dependent methyltransferase [Burkholderiales bacterium]|nr:class I SAM-dependent methyltransferase [Burkholderiales bacterium]